MTNHTTHIASPVSAEQPGASKITDTASARAYVDAWHRKHFLTDRTFSRYIMADPARSNPLAGDFAWQLAKALESMEVAHLASQSQAVPVKRYGWVEDTSVGVFDIRPREDGAYVKFTDVEHLLATQQGREAQAEQASINLHNAIMNLPCKRTMSHFATAHEMRAYKHGHRDARHAAAELAIAAPSAQMGGAQEAPPELSDGGIDEVWNAMPGGSDGWLKQFGYRQFARSIARHVLVRVAASMAGTIRPTDDELWEQTIGERDNNHEWADKLAGAIANHFDAEIGEHSNMNCPWAEALDVIEGAQAVTATPDTTPPNAEVLADEAALYRDLTGAAMKLGYDGIPAALEALRGVVAQEGEMASDWKVGNLLTMSDSDYPGMGGMFAQVWQGDDLIARVYGDSADEVRARAALVASASPSSTASALDEAKLLAEYHAQYGAAWMHGGRVGSTIPTFEAWKAERALRSPAGEDKAAGQEEVAK